MRGWVGADPTSQMRDVGHPANVRSQQSLLVELDDNLSHQSTHAFKGGDDLLSPDTLGFAERYANSEIHLIIRLRDRKGEDCVAILQKFDTGRGLEPSWTAKSRAEQLFDTFLFRLRESVRDDTSPCGDQKPVLVSIVHCVDIPEVPTITSRVWLGIVDSFDRFWPRSLYFSHLSGFISIGTLEYGVIGIFDAGIDTDINQTCSQVIQSTSKVLNSIPNHQGEVFGNILDEMDIISPLSGLKVVLMADGVWSGIVEGSDCPFEVTDVLLGPF